MGFKTVLRHLVGYLVGIGIFLVVAPYGLWKLTLLDHPIFNIPIIPLDTLRDTLSALLFLVGISFVIWSNLFLLLKGKGGPTDIGGLRVSPPTQELVVHGPYRHTRNPMVFGVFTIYVGWVLYLNSLAGLVVLILFFHLIAKRFLAGEEQRLLNDFGDAYEAYRAKTPRVVPFIEKQRRNVASRTK